MNSNVWRWITVSNLVVLLLLVVNVSFSQNVSVDHFTGRALIKIDFGVLSSEDIVVPIGLAHHGDAIALGEGEGQAGLGWNLIASGAIYRNLRGLPDDYHGGDNDLRRGWLFNNNSLSIQNFTSSSDDDLSICTDEYADYAFLASKDGLHDVEPDVFIISAPGLSGQFIFNSDGEPIFISHQNSKIEVIKSENGKIVSFIILAEGGVKYTFQQGNMVSLSVKRWRSNIPVSYFTSDWNYYNKELKFVNQWHLVKIESLKTGEEAVFNYTNGSSYENKDYRMAIEPQVDLKIDTLYYFLESGIPRRLQEVAIGKNKVNFTWENSLLSKVAFSEAVTNNKKEFAFHYLQRHSSLDLTTPRVYKAFLREISIKDDCAPVAAYKFRYQNVSEYDDMLAIPWLSMRGQDFYGFFNGKIDNKNIPKVYFYSQLSSMYRFALFPISGSEAEILNGEDREVDVSYMRFGALSELILPTGGVTHLTYEPNEYFDVNKGINLPGPGLRVKQISSNGSDIAYGNRGVFNPEKSIVRRYEYIIDSRSSGSIVNEPGFAFGLQNKIVRSPSILSGNTQVYYSRVQEIISQHGQVNYEFEVGGVFPETSNETWQATKNKIARDGTSNCGNYGNLINGYYSYPFAPSPAFPKNGLLTRKEVRSETGEMVSETVYQYALRPINPSIIKGLKFDKIDGVFHFGQYNINTGDDVVLESELRKDFGMSEGGDFIASTTQYTYTPNNQIQEILTTNPDGSYSRNKMKYAKEFVVEDEVSDEILLAIKTLHEQNRGNEIIESLYFTKGITDVNEHLRNAQFNVFSILSPGKVILKEVRGVLGISHSFQEAVIANQSLVFDENYKVVQRFKHFNSGGRPATIIDRFGVPNTYFYSPEAPLNSAQVYAAEAGNIVFEDFEIFNTFSRTGRTLKANQPIEITPGRTGRNAVLLKPGILLVNKETHPLVKGSERYRVSFWAKAALNGAVTLSLKNNGVVYSELEVTGFTSEWKYFENILDLTGVPASLDFEISSNFEVHLDEIIFMPSISRVSYQTGENFSGVTSVTDDNGNTIKNVYDKHGRLIYILDKFDNVVQMHEYIQQEEVLVELNPKFLISHSTVFVNAPIQFSASDNCVENLSYQWKINQQEMGTDPQLTHTFPFPGAYSVTLIVSHPLHGEQEFSEIICVKSPKMGLYLTVENIGEAYPGDSPEVYRECFGGIKKFSVQGFDKVMCPDQVINYRWYLLNNDVPGQQQFISETSLNSIEFSSITSNYTIICEIEIKGCPEFPYDCEPFEKNYSVSRSIQFIPTASCP